MVLGWLNLGKKCGLGELICGLYLFCSILFIGCICLKLLGGFWGYLFVLYLFCGMRFIGYFFGGGFGGGIVRFE